MHNNGNKGHGNSSLRRNFRGPTRTIGHSIIVNRAVAINRLTGGVTIGNSRIVGTVVGLNTVTAVGRIVSRRATRLITRRVNRGIVLHHRGRLRRTMVDSHSAKTTTRPHTPIIAVVNRISRNGASLLSCVHSAGITSNRTNNVARRVNTCRIRARGNVVAFLSAPKRTTFASVHTHNTRTASVMILIITTSSNIVPRAVRTVRRTGTTRMPIIITIGGVSGPRTSPSHIGGRLSRCNVLPRR